MNAEWTLYTEWTLTEMIYPQLAQTLGRQHLVWQAATPQDILHALTKIIITSAGAIHFFEIIY